MAVFRMWQTGVVFNEEAKYLDPGSPETGFAMVLVSEMKQGLSRSGKYSVPYQYPGSKEYLIYKLCCELLY